MVPCQGGLEIPDPRHVIRLCVNTIPSHLHDRRGVPGLLLVAQPQAHNVALGGTIVFECVAAVQNAEVVDETKVPRLHIQSELVLGSDKVNRVQGLGLRLGDGWDPRGSRCGRGACKDPAGEIEYEFAVVEVQERTLVIGRVAAKS